MTMMTMMTMTTMMTMMTTTMTTMTMTMMDHLMCLSDLHARPHTYHEVSQRAGSTQRNQERCTAIGLQCSWNCETLAVMHADHVSGIWYSRSGRINEIRRIISCYQRWL